MLQKINRLTKDKDFKRINSKGKSFFSPDLKIKFLANTLNNSRFAVVVSVKASKKAVVRNRIKRQIREIIRLSHEKIKPGFDVVVSVKSTAIDKSYQELDFQLSGLFKKANLF